MGTHATDQILVSAHAPNFGIKGFIPKFFPVPMLEISSIPLLEIERTAPVRSVLFYRFMFSIFHKLHGRDVLLPSSLLQGFTGALLVHGCVDTTPLMCINICPTPLENSKLQPCFLHLYSLELSQFCWILHGSWLHHKSLLRPEEFFCLERLCHPF